MVHKYASVWSTCVWCHSLPEGRIFYAKLRERAELPEGFTASSGWLTGFKSCYGILNHHFEGEADSVDLRVVTQGQLKNCNRILYK